MLRILFKQSSLAICNGLIAAVLSIGCGSPPLPPWTSLPQLEGPLPKPVRLQLDEAVARGAWVFLGEGDHFVEEKYSYRLGFLRPLVTEHGYRTLALEMGGSDAARIDRYLESGDERWLDRVVLYGYRGESALEQRELSPFPQLAPDSCGVRYADSEKRFWRQIRELSQKALALNGQRIRLFGFDVDAQPGGGYQDARLSLAGCLGHPSLVSISARLTPEESGTAEISRLRALSAELLESPIADACGAEVATTTADKLKRLAASYETAIEWSRAGDQPTETLKQMFERRESLMFEQMQSIQEAGPGVLLAHNLHVARNSEQLRFGPDGHSLAMWRSVGSQLEAALSETPFIVWFLFGRGSRLHPSEPGCVSEVSVRRGSLEATLAELMEEKVGYINTLDAPVGSMVQEDQEFGTATSFGGGVVANSADALVFSPRATAYVMLSE